MFCFVLFFRGYELDNGCVLFESGCVKNNGVLL